MMRLIYTLLLIIFTVFAVAFAISNSELVTLNYYIDQITMPLSLALGFSLTVGFLIGVISCLKTLLFTKYEVRNLRKEVAVANKEIANLRAIPIKDEH
jgi:putative membrane protein